MKKYVDREKDGYKLTIRRIKWSICQTPRATNYAGHFFVRRRAGNWHSLYFYHFFLSHSTMYDLSVYLMANILIADDYIGLIKRQWLG